MTVRLRCPVCENKLWRSKRCDTPSCGRYQDPIKEPLVSVEGTVTVGEVREMIDDLDADDPVIVSASGAWSFASDVKPTEIEKGRVEIDGLLVSEQ